MNLLVRYNFSILGPPEDWILTQTTTPSGQRWEGRLDDHSIEIQETGLPDYQAYSAKLKYFYSGGLNSLPTEVEFNASGRNIQDVFCVLDSYFNQWQSLLSQGKI